VTQAQPAEALEHEVYIAARPETVFAYFTDPDKMVMWKGIEATLDPLPGGIYRVSINGRDVARGEYVEVIPNSRVVFTWGRGFHLGMGGRRESGAAWLVNGRGVAGA
jgi:uncharacterized protein YndB with AHSA1/START domain